MFASKILVKFRDIIKKIYPTFVALYAIQGFRGVAKKSCSVAEIAFYMPRNIEKQNHIFC